MHALLVEKCITLKDDPCRNIFQVRHEEDEFNREWSKEDLHKESIHAQ